MVKLKSKTSEVFWRRTPRVKTFCSSIKTQNQQDHKFKIGTFQDQYQQLWPKLLLEPTAEFCILQRRPTPRP